MCGVHTVTHVLNRITFAVPRGENRGEVQKIGLSYLLKQVCPYKYSQVISE